MNTLPTIAVVNQLLHVGFREKNDDFSAIKIQKMLYFLCGWYVAITGEVLLEDQFIKGQYGPVIPTLQSQLKKFGSLAVDDYIHEWDNQEFKMRPLFVNTTVYPQFSEILEKVWKQYHRFTAEQLSTMCHSEDSPWAKTAIGKPISNELIKEHFLALAHKNQQKRSLIK